MASFKVQLVLPSNFEDKQAGKCWVGNSAVVLEDRDVESLVHVQGKLVMFLHTHGVSCLQRGSIQGVHAKQIATIMLFPKSLPIVARSTNGEALEQVPGDSERQLMSKVLNGTCAGSSLTQ